MKTATFALAAGALAVTGLGAAFVAVMLRPGDNFAACREGAVAGGDIGGPFTLVDGAGATVTEAEVITAPSILYFGYTFCPDVCPMDNMRNAQAVDVLEADYGILATPVFVSVDPERDTPEVVGAFARNFHDRMIGLTGSPEQVAAAAAAYRVYFRKQEAQADDPYYLVGHTVFSYVVLPGFGVVDFVRREETPEELAARVACFVRAAA